MTLSDFWPTPEAVAQCVPSEAEVISDAAFLAVHQPIKLFRRSLTDTSAEPVPADERAVLDELLKKNLPEGYTIVPIVGPSGVGKSHLIRWLGLHVSGNRHVIRIPKSTSLRRILESILDGLNGPVYAEIRDQLKTAREQLDDIAAEELLLAHFRTALRRRTDEARADCDAARSRDGKVDPVPRAVAETHGPGLLALLEGPTKDVLLQGTPVLPSVFRTLVRRVTTGVIEAEHGEFKPDHFVFPTVPVKDPKSYLSKLKSDKLKERTAAADLMNAVRDGAVGQLLGLGENQLADLFRRVREELLKEKRELVLLIEDFSTLAGVQRGLLDVIKMEGIHAGKHVLCPLRTALAVTDGFLTGYDTIKTRAGQEFVLREQPADERELIETITDMIGAYLNAARLGAELLDNWFAGTGRNPDKKPPSFEGRAADLISTDRAALDAFGKSGREHSLFPFNRAAVRQLADQHLRPNKDLLLNPRKLIKDVIHATLLNHRDAFVRGEFPGEGFHQFNGSRLGIDVQQWLKQRRPLDHQRYEVLLGYWGDLPNQPHAVKLHTAVYSAFRLTPLSEGAVEVSPVPDATPVGVGPKRPPVVEPKPERDPVQERIDKRLEVLDRWATEKKITQPDATALRNDLLEMLDAAIDWDSELYSVPRTFHSKGKGARPADEDEEEEDDPGEGAKFPREPLRTAVGPNWVYLPFSPTATGAKANDALFTVCSDDATGLLEVRFQLRALVRFHARKTFDYEGGDEDRAWYARLCERAARQAVPFLRKRYERVPDNDAALEAVAQALYVSARVLNLDGAHSNQDAEVVKAVLHPGPSAVPNTNSPSNEWQTFRRSCAANRTVARDFLLRRLSARQGTGEVLYGIDAARLLAVLEAARKSCRVQRDFPSGPLDENARQVRNFVEALGAGATDAAVKHRCDALTHWATDTRSWLGADFDKKAFVKECGELMTQAKNLGVFQANVGYDTLRDYAKAFDEAAVTEAIAAVDRLKDDAEPSVVLTALVRAPDDAMDAAQKFRLAFTAFVDQSFPAAVTRVRGTLQLAGADPNADPVTLLPAEGEKLDDDLKTIADALPAEDNL